MAEKDVIRVLIVEDDPVQRELLHDALEMERDIVCCGQAKDGVEALEALSFPSSGTINRRHPY